VKEFIAIWEQKHGNGWRWKGQSILKCKKGGTNRRNGKGGRVRMEKWDYSLQFHLFSNKAFPFYGKNTIRIIRLKLSRIKNYHSIHLESAE